MFIYNYNLIYNHFHSILSSFVKKPLNYYWTPNTVCWMGVKVTVSCALQYMSWNNSLIKVLNSFWCFKHQISTRISSEAYLKHYWRNCLQILPFFIYFFNNNLFNYVSNMLSAQILVKIWCLKHKKIFKTLIISRFYVL